MLFFLPLISCENLAPPEFFWLLTPASPLAEAAHTACQQEKESKQGLGGLSSVCEERVSSTLQSFFSLTRHLDDARKPASAATTTGLVPQSRTEPQWLGGLSNPP